MLARAKAAAQRRTQCCLSQRKLDTERDKHKQRVRLAHLRRGRRDARADRAAPACSRTCENSRKSMTPSPFVSNSRRARMTFPLNARGSVFRSCAVIASSRHRAVIART